MRRLALLLAVLTLALAAPTPAAAASPHVSYKPPVEGPIVDPFRPTANPWDPGNRGVDYAPAPGTPVKAAADGEVVFAGQVGGQLHVVLLHADGIRTSYSFLQSIAVHRGDEVRQGHVVGFAGDDLHFGARVGETYIDPTTLFDDGPPKVFLVPDEVRRPATELQERAGLVRFLGPLATALRGAAGVGRAAFDRAARGAGAVVHEAGSELADYADEVRGMAHYARSFDPVLRSTKLVQTTVAWWNQRHDCTPADVKPPPLPERRVAVLVAGLGSSSDKRAAIEDVDAPGMGYVDTVRFSYLGGTAAANEYDSRDTTYDLREAGRRLSDLLAQVHRDHPGEAVDILAHDQGGLIARSALAYDYKADDPRYPRIANLITLASPNHGADIATAVTMVGHTESGELVQYGMDAVKVAPFDIQGESIHQMSETSWFLTKLNRKPPPDGIRLTSIGSRGDLLVPGIHTGVKGGRNVIVSVPGVWSDHGDLPGSEAGRREVALAAAGLPPTCQSFGDMVLDMWVSDAIATAEDMAGAVLYAGARKLDKYGVQDPPVQLPTRSRP